MENKICYDGRILLYFTDPSLQYLNDSLYPITEDIMIARNDDIDNAVYTTLCVLANKDLPWDMRVIGESTDAIKDVMAFHNIPYSHPGYVFIDGICDTLVIID